MFDPIRCGLVPHIHNKNHLLSKALENKVWLVCRDVIENTEHTLGVGCSCIIDPLGNIVASAQPLTENILIYHISSFTLQPQYIRHSAVTRVIMTICLQPIKYGHLQVCKLRSIRFI